ncbi:FecR family protein [Flammeovirga sp. EKP202]|uniref:FecR family protein n=1 Tax=Flammeovirga sp. EKP202 TaxID=2770592 RepID=UPI00165F4539|nr:FecR domain-containing protein [Flammeovirga sp. EKP202]MBD0403942.1 FecR family protein [Flammeovirga sp. EKP202]
MQKEVFLVKCHEYLNDHMKEDEKLTFEEEVMKDLEKKQILDHYSLMWEEPVRLAVRMEKDNNNRKWKGILGRYYESDNQVNADSTFKVETKTRKKTFPFLGWSKSINIAVSIFLLAIVGLKLLYNDVSNYLNEINRREVVVTDIGERREVYLPDGSIVTLGPKSTLEYFYSNKVNKRNVSLIGEGVFKVHHDRLRPFKVKTKGIETEVLGTTFRVKAYEDENVAIQLKNGKVAINLQGKQITTLRPGEKVIYDAENHKFTRGYFKSAEWKAWEDNKLYFSMTSLETVINSLEKYYNYTFEIDESVADYVVMGQFNVELTIEELLDIISYSADINYKIIEEKIIIRAN